MSLAERRNLVQIRACCTTGVEGMCVSGELTVGLVSMLELWKAVCLITSEINMCNYSALRICLGRACPLLKCR